MNRLKFSDQSRAIKFIALPDSASYKKHNRDGTPITVQLGLYKPAAVLTELSEGRVSEISIADAEKIAELISSTFAIPVKVIKSLKSESQGLLNRQQSFSKLEKTEEELYTPISLEFTNVEKVRSVVQLLEQNGYVSTSDRAALNTHMDEIEKSVQYNEKLEQTATTAQRDVMRYIIDPYIDALIDCVAKVTTAEALLGQGNSAKLDLPINHGAIARAILYDSCQGPTATIFLEQFRGLVDEKDSAEALSKIYQGKAELEASFARTGDGVPRLEAQRAIIAEMIEEKLAARFEAESNVGIPDGVDFDLARKLRQQLFCEGYKLDMIQLGFGDSLTLKIHPLIATIDAMKGDFGTESYGYFQSKHFWRTTNGEELKGPAAQARFNQILQKLTAPPAAIAITTATTTETEISAPKNS